MAQQVISINQQMSYLMSTQKWRDCQRKQYNVYAILPPSGFVFANSLEQPEQHKYILQRFGGRHVVHESFLTEQDRQFLGNNCYLTDGKKIVICGTRGEMWTVRPDKFVASYVETDGSRPEKVPTYWREYTRSPETAPSAKGCQIPVNYLGIFKADWGELKMNDPNSGGHYKGDILVVSNDGQSVSTINNEVFATTFNQTIGGWAQSGCVTPAGSIKEVTLSWILNHCLFVLPEGKSDPSLAPDPNLYLCVGAAAENELKKAFYATMEDKKWMDFDYDRENDEFSDSENEKEYYNWAASYNFNPDTNYIIAMSEGTYRIAQATAAEMVNFGHKVFSKFIFVNNDVKDENGKPYNYAVINQVYFENNEKVKNAQDVRKMLSFAIRAAVKEELCDNETDFKKKWKADNCTPMTWMKDRGLPAKEATIAAAFMAAAALARGGSVTQNVKSAMGTQAAQNQRDTALRKSVENAKGPQGPVPNAKLYKTTNQKLLNYITKSLKDFMNETKVLNYDYNPQTEAFIDPDDEGRYYEWAASYELNPDMIQIIPMTEGTFRIMQATVNKLVSSGKKNYTNFKFNSTAVKGPNGEPVYFMYTSQDYVLFQKTYNPDNFAKIMVAGGMRDIISDSFKLDIPEFKKMYERDNLSIIPAFADSLPAAEATVAACWLADDALGNSFTAADNYSTKHTVGTAAFNAAQKAARAKGPAPALGLFKTKLQSDENEIYNELLDFMLENKVNSFNFDPETEMFATAKDRRDYSAWAANYELNPEQIYILCMSEGTYKIAKAAASAMVSVGKQVFKNFIFNEDFEDSNTKQISYFAAINQSYIKITQKYADKAGVRKLLADAIVALTGDELKLNKTQLKKEFTPGNYDILNWAKQAGLPDELATVGAARLAYDCLLQLMP